MMNTGSQDGRFGPFRGPLTTRPHAGAWLRVPSSARPSRSALRARMIAALVACFLSFLASAPSAQASGLRMSVSPMKLRVTTVPGQSTVRTVNVYNNGDKPVRVLTRVADWTSTPTGEMDLAPPKPEARSAVSFITPELTEFTVAAHDDAIVRITLALPDSASGSYWGIVFFECDGGGPVRGLGLATNACFGTTIYLTAEGTDRRDDALTAMNVTVGRHDADVSLAFTVRNQGNVYHYPSGWVQVLAVGDSSLFEAEIPTRVLLPGHEVTYTRGWKPPLPGDYRMIVTLDLGLEALVQGVKAFTVPDPATRPNPPPEASRPRRKPLAQAR